MAKQKRKNGEGTVRLRKDGRWEGRVVIGYDDKGKPKTKSVLAHTKGECVERLEKLKVLLKHAELPLIRFHDLRHTFATHAMKGGVDPKTLSGILGHTNAFP